MAKTDSTDPGPGITLLVDEFMALASTWLKQGIRMMDRSYAEWEKKYGLLAEEAFALYKENSPDHHVDEKHRHEGESALSELVGHISGFKGFNMHEFIEKTILPDKKLLALESIPDEVVFNRVLDKEFWFPEKADDRKMGMAGRLNLLRMRTGMIFSMMINKTYKGWGKQQYQPRLLWTAYFAIPLLQEVIIMLERRQREHAVRFNYLHLANEKDLKRLVTMASRSIYSDGNIPEMKTGPKDPGPPKKVLSPVKAYLQELEGFSAKRLTILEESARVAGTPLLDIETFSYEINRRNFEKMLKEYERGTERWQEYFEGEGNDWIKDLEIISLQMQAILIARSTRRQFESKINKDILPLIEKLLILVRGSFEEIKAAENSPGFRDKILKESREGLRNLRLKTIPNLIDAFNKAQFLKSLSNFTRQVNHRFSTLEDTYTIIQRLDLENKPPIVVTKQINLKKIIDMEHLDRLKVQSDDFNTVAGQTQAEILRAFNEIGHMLQINLEAALELLDKDGTSEWKKQDAGKVVTDGLDRIYSRIENLDRQCRNIPSEWGNNISGFAFNFIVGINELLDNENITDLVIRQAKAEASRRYSSIRKRLSKHLRQYLRKTWKVLSFGLTGAQSGYMQLSKMTGISSNLEDERELMSYLYATDKMIQELPFIYQRLFRLQALNDASIFTGRTGEIARLEEDYQLWRTGNFASVAVVGKKGSGRTSLLNIASTSALKNTGLFRIDLPKGIHDEQSLSGLFGNISREKQPKTLDELELVLNGLSTPVVIIVENLHNAFIRTVNGFELVERFLLLISRTPAKVFWIVSCGIYMWNYFEKTISVRRYFYDVIELGDIDQEMVRDIIMKRHRLSAYELEFTPGERDKTDKRYKRLGSEQERQEYLAREFFYDLDARSQGNISVALLLWLLSVVSIKPNKVIISNEMEDDTGFLSGLPEDELFTLEAIVEMENLTISEHAQIFSLDEWMSEMLLLRLKNKGLLFRSGQGFQIHLLLYEQIIRVLDDKNILK